MKLGEHELREQEAYKRGFDAGRARGRVEGKESVQPIARAVARFLAWELPRDFDPDCGIKFDGREDDEWNKNKTWPVGTNLLTAEQARAMFEHCLKGD